MSGERAGKLSVNPSGGLLKTSGCLAAALSTASQSPVQPPGLEPQSRTSSIFSTDHRCTACRHKSSATGKPSFRSTALSNARPPLSTARQSAVPAGLEVVAWRRFSGRCSLAREEVLLGVYTSPRRQLSATPPGGSRLTAGMPRYCRTLRTERGRRGGRVHLVLSCPSW